MDDALSGQNVYGNLLINIPKHAIFIGGGRDMNVYDNVIINSGDAAIRYDARARDAILEETWFSEDVDNLCKSLQGSPWKSEIWQTAFPEYQTISIDRENTNDSAFVANPANSSIRNNIIFDKCASIGNFNKAVLDYSTVSDNKPYYLFRLNNVFKNCKEGNYFVDEKSPIYEKKLNDLLKKVGRN